MRCSRRWPFSALIVLIPALVLAQKQEPRERPDRFGRRTVELTVRPIEAPEEAKAPPRLPRSTIYGHPPTRFPRAVDVWGRGVTAWKPSGGLDGLGYWYYYYTHVPGIGIHYYHGEIPTYYPGPYGVSPLTGWSHYGYGPYGW